MKICILHYHLNKGGVTSVINLQIKALRTYYPECEICLYTGHCQNPEFYITLGVQLVVFEELNYLIINEIDKIYLQGRLNKLINFLTSNIPKDAIIHAHNINLGKNPVLTFAIYKMAKLGYLVFNHCHDFAEDRPFNLDFSKQIIIQIFNTDLAEVFYPKSDNYLIAVLNSNDYRRLIGYGVNSSGILLLPNPIDINKEGLVLSKEECRRKMIDKLKLTPEKLIITYPVRVIRRKNIGEFILLAVLFQNSANWLVTLPPENPVEIAPYENWKTFCIENKIDIKFESGMKVNFNELIRASDFCINTSIQEGFGIVFLEPWTFNTPVTGRNLHHVTEDFISSGMIFHNLYNSIDVAINQNITDFKDVPANIQQDIVLQCINSTEYKNEIISINPSIQNIFTVVPDDIVYHNNTIINSKYSIKQFFETLYEGYQRLISSVRNT